MSQFNAENPMLPIGSDKCRCTACGDHFNSGFAFSSHRSGAVGIDRRCLSDAERLAKGWELSSTGHWHTGSRGARGNEPPEAVLAAVGD
jgi:hypothetical protein